MLCDDLRRSGVIGVAAKLDILRTPRNFRICLLRRYQSSLLQAGIDADANLAVHPDPDVFLSGPLDQLAREREEFGR